MYYLFREMNILPGVFYNLPPGEKAIVRAFFEYDMDRRKEDLREIENRKRLYKLMNR